MRIFAGVPRGGALKDSGAVDAEIFGYFGGYFFGNFKDKASIVCSPQTNTNKKTALW